jgi:hypothetical protein
MCWNGTHEPYARQMQLSIKLNIMSDEEDKFFMVMFMGMAPGTVTWQQNSHTMPPGKSHRPLSAPLQQKLDWLPLGRTEVVKAKLRDGTSESATVDGLCR